MAIGTWIGGFLGFVIGGPLGAIAGAVFGRIAEKTMTNEQLSDEYNRTFGDSNNDYQQRARRAQQMHEGQRNSFLFSLLTLASYIIRADGKVMHSEMELVRNFLRQNFGEGAVQQGEAILLKLFDYQKQVGWQAFSTTIRSACQQLASQMDYAQRLQLLNFLVMVAQADGVVVANETEALREIATYLGLSAADVDSMLNLKDSSTNLDAAYKVLGIPASATDNEVKKAYRQMALKHHPDRVATLGDDVKTAAEKKFKEINAAKDLIFKARGL